MKKLITIMLFISISTSFGQNEAANWYFGDNAGINFDINTGEVSALNDGRLSTEEGCTSISDANGELLFYTNGVYVYDRNHVIMPNGSGLKGNQSSTQSAIIIPKPQSNTIYYIFTVDTDYQSDPDEGFNYSEVDMSLRRGFGDVTSVKNVNLINNTSEKLSAVLKDCQSGGVWVITFANAYGNSDFNDTFYAYEVTSTGVNTTPVISNFQMNVNERRGYLKISPNGKKIACANVRQGLYLFDFDTTTGLVSNKQVIPINYNSTTDKPQFPYGLEFSPNSELLYVSTFHDAPSSQFSNPSAQYGALLQYNLSATDIGASEAVIDNRQMFRSALQLGPDGKIYRSSSITYDIGDSFLSTINNPNGLGNSSNYQHASVSLGSKLSRQGLPPFISSFFTEKIDIINSPTNNTVDLPLCTGDSYTLTAENIPGAIYNWTQDGSPIATPTIPYELEVYAEGNYEVAIELITGDCGTLEGQAIVSYHAYPVAHRPNNIIICDDNNDNSWDFDFTIQNSAVLDSQDSNIYSVHYFENQLDADNNENEITSSFPSQPSTIFARVHNKLNPNCYDTTSFDLKIFNTPIANTVDTFVACDDDLDGDNTNGQSDINLALNDVTILGNQNGTNYTITYHNSQINADNGSAALSIPYYNLTPFQETIFVRIENNTNPDCYSTTMFDVTVTPAPQSFDTSIIQCDEDGLTDGLTSFNLYEAEDVLTGGAANLSVKFHTTLNDAQNDIFEVDGNNFSNWANPQMVYVQVIDDSSGCSSIAKLSLEISTTQIADYQAIDCDEADSEDGINTFDLDGFTTDIHTINSINHPIRYYENYSDALLEQNELTSPYTNIIPYSQTIYARAENNNACYGISEISLTINKLPQLEDDETTFYCLNKYPETITLKGGVINDTPNNYYYSWSTGENTIDIEVNQAGTYTVEVTNTSGCTSQRTIVVENSNIATINSIDVIDGLQYNTVTIDASGEGTYEYALFNQDGMYSSYQANNTFTNVAPGIYTVAVQDIKNACGIVEELVSVIGFPRFFTPNNDGYNDNWQVQGISNQFQPNTKILIFDRYGKLIKQLDPLGNGWNGTFKGDLLPSDDYWFSVDLQDGRTFMDHFTLKR